MSRILLLTSCVGFLSSSCYVKMLVALIIALAFLWLFLYKRPYRSALNNILQSLTMLVPIVGLAYGLAGGWEKAAASAGTDDDVHAAYDSVSLVVIHTLIVLPPIAMGVMTVVGTIYMWTKTHANIATAASTVAIAVTMSNKAPNQKKKSIPVALPDPENNSWSTWSSLSTAEECPGSMEDDSPPKSEAQHDDAEVRPAAAGSTNNTAPVTMREKEANNDASTIDNRKRKKSSKKRSRSSLARARKKKNVRAAFKAADEDHSGTLEMDEFMHLCQSDDREAVRALFDLLDEDRSGSLDVDEVEHLLSENKALALAGEFVGLNELLKNKKSSRRRRTKSKVRKLLTKKESFRLAFEANDEDHNGSLDLEEFMHLCKSDDREAVEKLFEILDDDKSGTIDVDECERMLSNDKALALAGELVGLKELLRTKSRKRRGSKNRSRRKSKRKERRGTQRRKNDGEDSSRQQQRLSALSAAMGATPPPISRKQTMRRAGGPTLHTAVKLHSWAARAKAMNSLRRHNKNV